MFLLREHQYHVICEDFQMFQKTKSLKFSSSKEQSELNHT